MKLAPSVFHESTVIGLKQFGFNETASVVELFLKMWNVLNVSSPSLGKHKRDIFKDPVKSPDDWKLDFLLEFASFVNMWEKSQVSIVCALKIRNTFGNVLTNSSQTMHTGLTGFLMCAP